MARAWKTFGAAARLAAIALLGGVAAGCALFGGNGPEVPQAPAGPAWVAPGDALPGFPLLRPDGSEATLREASFGRPFVLVLFRDTESASCTTHLAALQRAEPQVIHAHHRIVAVGATTPERIQRMRDVSTIRFETLADPEGRLAEALGLLGPGGVQPALIVASSSGLVLHAHTDPDPRIRFPVDNLAPLLSTIR